MGYIPEELIAEILSYLDVKTILRHKCVSKSWNTLICNPIFFEKHLNKSSQNPHITLKHRDYNGGFSLVPFSVRSLLENPSITIQNDTLHQWEYHIEVAGSCNGLICLFRGCHHCGTQYRYRCSFWNPSTRTTYEDLVVLTYDTRDYFNPYSWKFTFGYDDSTRTYKVVAYRIEFKSQIVHQVSGVTEVKVFSVGDGDNCWRNIQSFPVIPLAWQNENHYTRVANHLNGTINWLAINNYLYCFYEYTSITHAEQFVIVSLDLSTETYKQHLLPQGFDEVPFVQPDLSVLMGCLCFAHDSKSTEFVLWQMKEYGVQESWTRLFKISIQNLRMHYPEFAYAFGFACLYINGDAVIFADEYGKKAVMYNFRDPRGETIKISNAKFSCAMNYVESLVSVP